MAKLKILVALRDVKVREYGPLMVFTTAEEAKRLFLAVAGDAKSTVGRFPRDYVMHELGTFDPESGQIVTHQFKSDLTPYSELDALLAERGAAAGRPNVTEVMASA